MVSLEQQWQQDVMSSFGKHNMKKQQLICWKSLAQQMMQSKLEARPLAVRKGFWLVCFVFLCHHVLRHFRAARTNEIQARKMNPCSPSRYLLLCLSGLGSETTTQKDTLQKGMFINAHSLIFRWDLAPISCDLSMWPGSGLIPENFCSCCLTPQFKHWVSNLSLSAVSRLCLFQTRSEEIVLSQRQRLPGQIHRREGGKREPGKVTRKHGPNARESGGGFNSLLVLVKDSSPSVSSAKKLISCLSANTIPPPNT